MANGPRLDEFLAEMNAEVGLDRRNLLTVGEMPGSIDRRRPGRSPTRTRHELNMVFTFEHVSLDQRPGRHEVGPGRAAAAGAEGATWPTGRTGLADVGWNSLYWDNHDQPRAVSRFGDDSPSTG